jgi:selenocysteine lyase/cysteine desulfurase
MPFIANTHTETTVTGTLMSKAYEEAKQIIKLHVGANNNDALIFCGSGTTHAVNKLQRILGLRMPERMRGCVKEAPASTLQKPVVFVTEMEHHSNHISWLETTATVEIIKCSMNGHVDIEHFKSLLQQYKHHATKIAAVTACSNVTGIQTPYHDIAKMVHQFGGLCFVDFACSAPYVNINMHPQEHGAHLDAIYFSPHKFLGGPGTPGVLVFNKKMYKNTVPDQPGGGTVVYTNPWNDREYISDIEQREDGGTPPFLQGIKAAMCIRLKEEMGVENMRNREEEILRIVFDRFERMKHVQVLEKHVKKRLGVIAFMVEGAHYNLVVKMLNDRFGIQTRGGCSCAGTYGHRLLHVDKAKSYKILNGLRSGNLLCKPGWVRLSVHPTLSNVDVEFIMDAIETTALHFKNWALDYIYDAASDDYTFKGFEAREKHRVDDWFNVLKWG